ncbi:hypothetical protein V8C37DRAFT_397099 [Trichoderma ceciliae]
MFLKHPQNTFIVDFECMPSADGPMPLQVAIFDASEQHIVPATIIDHEMPIGELRNKISVSKFHQARGIFSPVTIIQKFYPSRYQDRTKGMTCHAIADLIRKHVDNAEFLAVSLRQNRNFLGEDDTDLFVADAHAMNTIKGSTSGGNKGLGEPTTLATRITKGKRAVKTTGATKATKTHNPNADYNHRKKDHNSNNIGESIDE